MKAVVDSKVCALERDDFLAAVTGHSSVHAAGRRSSRSGSRHTPFLAKRAVRADMRPTLDMSVFEVYSPSVEGGSDVDVSATSVAPHADIPGFRG